MQLAFCSALFLPGETLEGAAQTVKSITKWKVDVTEPGLMQIYCHGWMIVVQ